MKKYAMTIIAFLLASPAIFLIKSSSNSTVLFIFIGLVIPWGLLELFISLSQPLDGLKPPHPLIKISRLLWLFFAAYAWFDFKFELTTVYVHFWILASIFLCCLSALIIRLFSVLYLSPSFSYDLQIPQAGKLICSGPYRFIRHPSYLGLCILASLPGLILGSVIGFIGMLLSTMVTIILRADYEDSFLEHIFGHTYSEYKKKTYSVIPFVY